LSVFERGADPECLSGFREGCAGELLDEWDVEGGDLEEY